MLSGAKQILSRMAPVIRSPGKPLKDYNPSEFEVFL
jgi:hypothetical protein